MKLGFRFDSHELLLFGQSLFFSVSSPVLPGPSSIPGWGWGLAVVWDEKVLEGRLLIGACTCRPQPWRRLGTGYCSMCVCLCVCAFYFLNEHWDVAWFFGLGMLEEIQAAWPLSLFWGRAGRGGAPSLLSKKEGFLAMQIYPVYSDLISSGPKRGLTEIRGALQRQWEGATAGLSPTNKLMNFLWVSHTSL